MYAVNLFVVQEPDGQFYVEGRSILTYAVRLTKSYPSAQEALAALGSFAQQGG